MIQELLGGGGSLINGGERKTISINGTILESPSSSTTTTTITNTTNPPPNTNNNSSTTTPPSTSENLRCPRCDSPNTKFCYYNNYNLTQPRHFCKTCRRYWTKGGALRNVPIGGGCRKNRSPMISSPSPFGKSNVAVGKLKAVASGFDNHELASSSIMWGPPQNSHILALLRAANHQNPNPNNMLLNSAACVKDEANSIGIHHHMMNDDHHHHRVVSELDSLSHSQVPFWKSNNIQQQNGFMVSETLENNNSRLQDLYQRLRSTENYYNSTTTATASDDDHPSIGNNNSMLTNSSSMLDSAPVVAGGGELGYWNSSAFSSWSTDLPTTNGAYP